MSEPRTPDSAAAPSDVTPQREATGAPDGKAGAGTPEMPQTPQTPETPEGVPPGFDAETYLKLNPDVAAAPDPVAHYRDHGRGELRAVRAKGSKISHPSSRMVPQEHRNAWRDWLAREAAQVGGLEAVLANHPRVLWLETGFTLPGYLRQRADVAEAIDTPLEAAFHFLEFGLEEGFDGHPEAWEPRFVKAWYGLDLTPDLTATKVLSQIFAQGVSPLEAALDEPQYWALKGANGAALAGLFDHEYYHAVATQAGLRPQSHDRRDCIDHFAQQGREQCLPVHPDHSFEPAFYLEQLGERAPQTRTALEAELAALKDADTDTDTEADTAGDAAITAAQERVLYQHWLNPGLGLGLAANARNWVKRQFGLDLPEALAAQLPVFALADGSLAAETPRIAVLRKLITQPRPALSALDLRAPELVDLVVSLADRTTIHGDEDQGEWLYWHALSLDGSNDRALRHLSDLLQRKDKLETVQALRHQVTASDGADWNTLALAETYLTCQRFEEAADQLAKLPAKALSDVAIAGKRRELAHQLFYKIWHNLGPHVAAYGVPRTQSQLRAALAVCTPQFSSAERSREVHRVALVGNDDLYQCKLYRVDQKAEQLREAGYEVTVISPNRDLDTFRARIDEFDAVIFFRVPAFPPMIDTIASAAQQGLLTFYEIDDVVFDTDHFPPAYETYAGQITQAEYDVMSCGVPLFEHAMSLCDYGISSTETITGLMEPRVRRNRVFEHHNALGRLHLAAFKTPPAPRAEGDPLVLFYGSGTRAHKEDFHDILEPALAEMLKRYPGQIEIRLIGHFSTFRHLDLETDPVTMMEPVWDFEEFMSRVAQADINLSVLVPTVLTDAKSEIKWMEAAMFAIPSVVSDTATHREVIEDGETGFLANTTEDFTKALDRLISDSALRLRVGQAAQAKVMAEYSLPAMGARLRNMFEDLRPPQSLGKAKKRLVVVNVFYPPQAIGGATRVVYDNVTLLREKYGDIYDIDVICTLEGGRTPFEVETYAHEGVRVWAITAPPQEMGDMQARDGRMGDLFERLIARLSPDLIHFHCIQRLTAAVVDAARLRDIPYVITLHDGWWVSPNQFIIDDHDEASYYDYAKFGTDGLPGRAQALARPLMSAQQLLAVSEPFAELHRDCALGNVTVIENGVSPLPACPRKPSENGRVRLAHIGGASRHKGIHLVRNALLANVYDNLELLLIDHAMAPGSARYETWGTTPVIIEGKVSQSEIADLYARIDILLAPSIWPESYGLVTREAMAMDAWVIAGDQGAIGADIVEGVNGHKVDVSTYAGLSEILSHVDKDPERYRRAPTRSEELRTVSDQVDDLAKLYAKILGIS